MFVLVIGVSMWSGVEVSKLHLDHTPRWPPRITPLTALKLHQLLGRYPRLPVAITIAVALRQAIGTLLAIAGTGMSANLHLHQALGGKADHLAQDIRVRGLLQDPEQPCVRKFIMESVIGRPFRSG